MGLVRKMDKNVIGQSPYAGILYNETDIDFPSNQNARQMQCGSVEGSSSASIPEARGEEHRYPQA